ncbi:MAG: hypothetical protein QNJ88_13000 [Acidimicrobiia bacterium]|nr:hypothetical protein [Acidimicrobiia bacterium]
METLETPDSDAETYETIPWAQLAPPATPLLTRVGTWVVGALVAAVLTYLLVAVLRDEPKQAVVALDPKPAPVAAATSSPTAAPATVSPPVGGQDLGAIVAYSEADLMAIAPEEDRRVAEMRAVWFVTDYFTVDGDAQTAADVRSALPTESASVVPHDQPEVISYVEWAHPFAVQPDGPGHYVVDVAFRTLQGSAGSVLARQPVRAVRVRVAILADGSVAIRDLPEPVEIRTGVAEAVPPPSAEPPPEVVEQLTARIASHGTLGDVLGAGVGADGWRVVVAVRDSSGLSWPLVVRP